jgi:hypothetical protein
MADARAAHAYGAAQQSGKGTVMRPDGATPWMNPARDPVRYSLELLLIYYSVLVYFSRINIRSQDGQMKSIDKRYCPIGGDMSP